MEKKRFHELDIAVCGDIARSRNSKDDPLSAQIAINFGNSLLKSSDPKLRFRGMEYLQMGMCLDLNILKKHFGKYQISDL